MSDKAPYSAPPGLPDLPPTPRDVLAPTASELMPFTSKKINLRKSGILVPAAVTAVTCCLLYSISQFTITMGIIGAYLLFMLFYAGYAYSGIRKNILVYAFPVIVVFVILETPLFSAIALVFRHVLPGNVSVPNESFIPLFIHMFFGAGMCEELVKAIPALIGLVIALRFAGGRSPLPPSVANWLKVSSPLEGILFGLAAGAAFIFDETLFEYVPNMIAEVAKTSGMGAGIANGFWLLFPRVLQSITGHMGWAAISGYFIGMSARYPRSMIKLLIIGWIVPSTLHGFWNSASALGPWAPWVSTALSLFLFVGCFLKAKQLEAMQGGRVFVPTDSIIMGTPPVPVATGTLPEAHATSWGGLAQVVTAFTPRTLGAPPPMPVPAPSQAQVVTPQPFVAQTPATPVMQAPAPQMPVSQMPVSQAPVPQTPVPQAAASPAPVQEAPVIVPIEVATPRFTLANGAARFGILAGQTIDLSTLFPGVGLPPGTLAEVTVNPRDATALGLKNMTSTPWSATTSDGAVVNVSPGKNVRLVADETIVIGTVEIKVQAI